MYHVLLIQVRQLLCGWIFRSYVHHHYDYHYSLFVFCFLFVNQLNLLVIMECLAVVYLLIYKRHLINLTCLLQKMEHYGIKGTALNWFTSYLYETKQYVSVNGNTSDLLKITYDVDQGSALGPLFLIYEVIKMAAKTPNICSFGPLLNRHRILYLFDYLTFRVLIDIIISP